MLWGDSWEFRNWYINFQAPYQRTTRGIVVEDLTLDIKVDPDLSWEWKDQDEFDEMVSRGVITLDQIAGVESVREEVINLVERRMPRFDSTWSNWRPPKNWAVPKLPKCSDPVG